MFRFCYALKQRDRCSSSRQPWFYSELDTSRGEGAVVEVSPRLRSRCFYIWCLVAVPAAFTACLAILLVVYSFAVDKNWCLQTASRMIKQQDEPKIKPRFGLKLTAELKTLATLDLRKRMPSPYSDQGLRRQKRTSEEYKLFSKVRISLVTVPAKRRYKRIVQINQNGITSAALLRGRHPSSRLTSFELLLWENGKFSLRWRDTRGGRIQFLAADFGLQRVTGCHRERAADCLQLSDRNTRKRVSSTPFFRLIPESKDSQIFSIEFAWEGVNKFFSVKERTGQVLLQSKRKRTKFRLVHN